MNKIVYPNYRELSIETARFIGKSVQDNPYSLLCFPAGETSIGTFNELIELYRTGNISFKNCKIVGLDEWVNLGELKNENCYHFLKKHLLNHIDLCEENICFFNGESGDLDFECHKTDKFIKSNNGIDLMLLGAGMNGHIGLNEPGTSFNQYSHVVELDTITKYTGQKYFSSKVFLSLGITLGIKHILETKTVILQVSGHKKSDIVNRLLKTEITNAFPVSILKEHSNSFLFIDSEAAGITI